MQNQNTDPILSIDRARYAGAMADNLPMLRAKLGLSQTALANVIGVTRQTVSAMENKTREISWPNFLSLLFLFTQNEETRQLLPVLGIYTEELSGMFSMTNLEKLR